MKLSRLLALAGLDGEPLEYDPEVTSICPDSTRVSVGGLYVAVEGLRKDGHGYLHDAVSRGAAAAVISKDAVKDGRVSPQSEEIPLICVDDTRVAVARLFAAWYGNPQRQMRIVGVTGTNGKTTVSTLIYEILTRFGIRTGLIGTVGCKIGQNEIVKTNMTTPDPEELYRILDEMRRSGAETVVMEVSSHALALHKVEPILFDVSVFTNLTEDHLDFHGDMESYFCAKAKLMTQSRRAVINLDDRYMRTLKKCGETAIYTCSAEGREAMILAEDIHERGTLGIEYKITSHSLRLRVRSPMAGRFNVMNTMQAAVVADLLGVPAREIRASLSRLTGAAGRLEKLKTAQKTDFSVYIDYAHTPDALENLLRTVRGFLGSGERLVLLFGCGGDRDRLKRPMMGRIATSMADHVIITSDNNRSESPSEIIADILQGVSQDACYTVIEDRREAIEYAIKSARMGDVILLAGKGHEAYEIDRDGKRPFDEKSIVEKAMEKYYG